MLRMAILWVLLTTGCAQSVHPIHEPKEAITEPAFVGTWIAVDDPLGQGRYQLTEHMPGQYRLTAEKGATAEKLEGRVEPKGMPMTFCQCGPHFFHSVEVRSMGKTFYVTSRLSILGDRAYLRPLDDLLLRKALQDQPKALEHRFEPQVGSKGTTIDRLVVTAPTPEFQAYVVANVDAQGVWMVPQFYKQALPRFYERVGGVPTTETGICSQRYRTFNYWWEARCLFQEWKSGVQPRTAEALKLLTTKVRELPTQGVDSEATECVKGLCQSLEDAADRLAPQVKLSAALHGFLRCLSGKSPSASFEETASNDQAVARLVESAEHCRKTRALLSDRHDLMFSEFE